MARYLFQFPQVDSGTEHEGGMAVGNEGTALEVALRAARELLADAVLQGRLPLNDCIVVIDRKGQAVLSLTLGEAVGLQRGQHFTFNAGPTVQ